jgi:hypothetical protein
MRRFVLAAAAVLLGLGLWASASPARAQFPTQPEGNQNIGTSFYYPYHYFPHNYWPLMSPRWPEPPGAGYMRYPAYMAYPPFREPHWRYEAFEPQRYYRGFHFWLDAF